MRSEDAEYARGREAGYRVASAALKTQDRDRVEADAREMRTDARKRGSDTFDRGYALGYMDALRGDRAIEALTAFDEARRGK